MNPECRLCAAGRWRGLATFLDENRRQRVPSLPSAHSARARDAARKARDLVIRKSPGVPHAARQAADCSERDSTKTELYIVEAIPQAAPPSRP